ncbi:MAG: nuclear transport factor 2 family protein [Ktedonobacteraceae bacterium]
MTQSTRDLSQRTPQEVFEHHAQSLGKEDLDATVLDYAETASLITPSGVMRGKDAIRQFFTGVFQTLPHAKWNVKPIFADNILFLEWTADSEPASVSDGVDTVVFQNGLIQVQTVRCTIVPKKG